ncbi:MAG: hypothetical protein ACR2J8_01520 [Thermomicrobiales bacterium]
MLAFDWNDVPGAPGATQRWGGIREFCMKVPQHPVCQLQGGHNPNDNGHHHHHGPGDLHHHGDDGGNLGWYPFS